SLEFTGRAGGQHPPLQYLSISETDVQPVRWTCSADAAWIELPSRGDTVPFFLGIGVGTQLVPGVYRGTVTVARPSTGDRRSVPVTLSLFSTAPLAGRWAGRQDSVGLTLRLVDSSGQVSGDGTVGPPAPGRTSIRCGVGTRADAPSRCRRGGQPPGGHTRPEIPPRAPDASTPCPRST